MPLYTANIGEEFVYITVENGLHFKLKVNENEYAQERGSTVQNSRHFKGSSTDVYIKS